jgi:hypothetical protein
VLQLFPARLPQPGELISHGQAGASAFEAHLEALRDAVQYVECLGCRRLGREQALASLTRASPSAVRTCAEQTNSRALEQIGRRIGQISPPTCEIVRRTGRIALDALPLGPSPSDSWEVSCFLVVGRREAALTTRGKATLGYGPICGCHFFYHERGGFGGRAHNDVR